MHLMEIGYIPQISEAEKNRHENVYKRLNTGNIMGFMLAINEFNVSNLDSKIDDRVIRTIFIHKKLHEAEKKCNGDC